jgi:alpha-L-rhamnosidase
LSENGLHGLADEIFMKEDFPGWLYAVKKGATTIWERWNSILPNGDFDESGMNSLNHYAYGSIGSWQEYAVWNRDIRKYGFSRR